MPEFDYSQYDNGDDYTTVDAIYEMMNQADSTSRPMSILLECYNKYEDHTSQADAIANDKEALAWLDDYWEYVCWNERGNEPSMDEVGGFKGMVEYITDPEMAGRAIDYLQYDDEIDEDAQNLIDRLKQITSRYNGVSKMKKSIDEDAIFNFIKNNNSCCYGEIYDYCKDIGMDDKQIDDAISNLKSERKIDFVNQMDYVVKSTKKSIPSIHDMIAQTRTNNNSLVKSRVNVMSKIVTNKVSKARLYDIKEYTNKAREDAIKDGNWNDRHEPPLDGDGYKALLNMLTEKNVENGMNPSDALMKGMPDLFKLANSIQCSLEKNGLTDVDEIALLMAKDWIDSLNGKY